MIWKGGLLLPLPQTLVRGVFHRAGKVLCGLDLHLKVRGSAPAARDHYSARHTTASVLAFAPFPFHLFRPVLSFRLISDPEV